MLTARRITKDELAKTGELFRIAFEFPDPNAEDNETMLKKLEENPDSRRAKFATEKWLTEPISSSVVSREKRTVPVKRFNMLYNKKKEVINLALNAKR
mgnify:CR=1 FL=1